jgi:hypothetical protein
VQLSRNRPARQARRQVQQRNQVHRQIWPNRPARRSFAARNFAKSLFFRNGEYQRLTQRKFGKRLGAFSNIRSGLKVTIARLSETRNIVFDGRRSNTDFSPPTGAAGVMAFIGSFL